MVEMSSNAFSTFYLRLALRFHRALRLHRAHRLHRALRFHGLALFIVPFVFIVCSSLLSHRSHPPRAS